MSVWSLTLGESFTAKVNEIQVYERLTTLTQVNTQTSK
jgi:hypothetical protein